MNKPSPKSCPVLTPMALYVEGSPPREPFVERQVNVIYLQPHLRFRIGMERSSDIGYGLWRDDQMQDQGLAPADADSTEFAQTLVQALSEQLSIHNLRDLVAAFQAELDKEEARRQRYREQRASESTHALPATVNSV